MENKAKEIEEYYNSFWKEVNVSIEKETYNRPITLKLNRKLLELLAQQETFYREKAIELNLPLEWVKELYRPNID